ncbi:50S ribosomal protein L22 [Candidatus Micrarchaeota archaeon]|nr:50S ribosomal protein L22 [Candidatus Micrarchaeota archaeon]
MYSYAIPEEKKEHYAMARAEDLEASYKDLTQVCGRLRKKSVKHALSLLEKASNMEIPILFKKFNTKLAHRRELGGSQGRYPQKAAGVVLEVLNSAIANAKVKGLNEDMIIVHILANGKHSYPRMSPKGKRVRHHYATSRIEIVLKEKVETKKEKKKLEPKVEAKETPATHKQESHVHEGHEHKEKEHKHEDHAHEGKEHEEHKHDSKEEAKIIHQIHKKEERVEEKKAPKKTKGEV